MRRIPRLSLFVLILFLFAHLDAEAQFLGQQSLSESSYVIDQSGTLWVWGQNLYAQLGLGDRIDRDTPCVVPIPEGASKWVLVAGGEDFTIAVADSDKLYAWGLNNRGQIGLGQAGGLYGAPMRIPNPPYVTNWKWVSAGAGHCEALTTDGRLFAWGDNADGELGVGNEEYLPSPEPVEFPTGVTSWAAVAAGPGYTMMISQGGQLYGCGMDSLGTFQPWEGPQLVMPDTFRAYSPLACVAASYTLESRIDQVNSLNNYGIFGLTDDSGVAPNIAEVADGGQHSLFLTEDGEIAASGDNTFGQLTISKNGKTIDTFNSVLIPFPDGVTQFVAVAAGMKHSLAIGNDGWLYAWGDDSAGEIGIGNYVNQNQPVRVLKVCPPLAMSATLSIPDDFFQPYSITLTVKNTSTDSTLTNADAFLLLSDPLTLFQSSRDENVPGPILPKASAPVTWNGGLDQVVLDSLYPNYFAYVRAEGSAPLLVYEQVHAVISGPWVSCDQANVVDSLTGDPIVGAELVNPGPPVEEYYIGMPFDSDKMISDKNGNFSLCFKGPVTAVTTCPLLGSALLRTYPFNLVRENYQTHLEIFPEPIPTQVTFTLGPSNIQGTFAVPAPPFIADSILKVYYPDSLTGYALSRREIFRTRDSGISWSAMFLANADLHDIKFFDPAHGCVVGDRGLILSTTDTGELWQAAPPVTTQNLRAVAMIDLDTAWAVGDDGTVLKKMGGAWSLQPPLSKQNLTAIHFLDPTHGAIVGDNIYYLFDEGTWSQNTIAANLQAVYYTAPGQLFFAGTNGNIIYYDDSDYVCKPDGNLGDLMVDTLTYDSTYTAQTINSLYFLNKSIGYAVGDSGASFVTYDGGYSWADMLEFPHTATSVNFFSLSGHAATDNAALNYTGMPNAVRGIVRGRLTYGNPPEPIVGAEVDRIYESDSGVNLIETAFTSEQGNFVFAGIDTFFPYQYVLTFSDSGIEKTHTFANVTAHPHTITTLDYNDYTPPPLPPPDTNLSVNTASEPVLSLAVSASQAFAHIAYSLPMDGNARLIIQDILGREVRMISDGFHAQGPETEDLSLDGMIPGAYYVTLETGEGVLTKKFVVLQ